MKVWTYKDKSDSKIPSRSIKWTFNTGIIKVVYQGGWNNHSISVTLLWLINIHMMTNHFCGNHVRFRTEKWGFSIAVERGWHVSLFLGISHFSIVEWQTRRAIRKMTPGQLAKIRNIFQDLTGRLQEKS